jgi:hypothetical protein
LLTLKAHLDRIEEFLHCHLGPRITKDDLIAFLTPKLKEVYYRSGTWRKGEAAKKKSEWVQELQAEHDGALLSETAQSWLDSSFTAQV